MASMKSLRGSQRFHRSISRMALLCLLPLQGLTQAGPEQREDEAVRSSVSYVFATDLGSGVYDLDGRTLQIYQLTWRKALREPGPEAIGLRIDVPMTFGFFDFKPEDVLSQGIPTRVDSFSVAPGLAWDLPMRNDWRFKPYARAGFSVASSSVDGWVYGAGLRVEREMDFHGWDSLARIELAYAGVDYRDETSSDDFVRARQGYDFTRAMGWKLFGRDAEIGLYAIIDAIIDPPTVPLHDGERAPLQAEFGFTLATRPRIKVWRFDVPRLGFGYRFAEELSAWRIVIGRPF
jgi:hypothetical protein